MRKLTLITVVAAAAIAAFCAHASAVTFSPAGTITASVNRVTLQDSVFGGQLSCDMSLTIALSRGAIALPGTIGSATGGNLTNCTIPARLSGFPSSFIAAPTRTRSVLGTVSISVVISGVVHTCSISIQISEPINVTVLGPTRCSLSSIMILGPLTGSFSPSQSITP